MTESKRKSFTKQVETKTKKEDEEVSKPNISNKENIIQSSQVNNIQPVVRPVDSNNVDLRPSNNINPLQSAATARELKNNARPAKVLVAKPIKKGKNTTINEETNLQRSRIY
jgi:hypothetical protein